MNKGKVIKTGAVLALILWLLGKSAKGGGLTVGGAGGTQLIGSIKDVNAEIEKSKDKSSTWFSGWKKASGLRIEIPAGATVTLKHYDITTWKDGTESDNSGSSGPVTFTQKHVDYLDEIGFFNGAVIANSKTFSGMELNATTGKEGQNRWWTNYALTHQQANDYIKK